MEENRRAFLLFSHKPTIAQKTELVEKWRAREIINLTSELQKIWSNVPPHLESISTYLKPVLDWLTAAGSFGDVVVIQGDFGAVYLAVKKALEIGMIPLYATTQRKVEEALQSDGSVKQKRVFRHVRFRVFGE